MSDSQVGAQGFEEGEAEEVSSEALPTEVAADIDSELEALEKAAAAETPGTPHIEPSAPIAPADLSLFEPSFGLGGGFAAEAPPQRQRTEDIQGSHRTLEELCSAHPRLAIGESWLHIKRTKPTSYHGKPCSGWIEDVHQPLTTGEVKERYGGGTFEISVLGPHPSDPGRNRTLGRVTLVIAGVPKFIEDEKDPMRGYPVAGDTKTEQMRLRAELEDRARLQQQNEALQAALRKAEAAAASRGSLSLPEIENYAAQRAEEVRQAGLESLSVVKAENNKLQAKLDDLEKRQQELRAERDREVATLKEELLRLKTEGAQARQIEETNRIRELKEEHRNVLSDLKERYEDRVRQEKEAHDRELRQLRDRHEEERRNLTERLESERRDRREEHDRAVAILRADAERAANSLKETYAERFKDLERANKSELASLKAMFDAQLESIRSSEKAMAKSTEVTAAMRVELLAQQLEEARVRGQRAEAEAREAQARLHRSPLEAIGEARELITNLGGSVVMGAGGGEENEELTWQKVVVRGLQTVAEKGAEVFEHIQGQRAQNQAMAEAQAQQQAHAQALAQHQAAQQAAIPRQIPAPAAQTPQRRPFRAERFQPHVPESTSPFPISGKPRQVAPASSVPLGGQRHPESIPLDRPTAFSVDDWLAAETPAPEPEVSAEVAQEEAPPPQEGAPEASEAGVAPQAEQQPQAGLDLGGLPPEAIGTFIHRLNQAIEDPVISEKMFAKGLINDVGPDVARQVVSAYTADEVVAMAKSFAGGSPELLRSPLFKLSGKQYVRKVWAEAKALLGVVS